MSNYVTKDGPDIIIGEKNFKRLFIGDYVSLLYEPETSEFFIHTLDTTKYIHCLTKIDMHTNNIMNVGTITGLVGDFTNINTSLANLNTAIGNAKSKCEKISTYSGYATGNHTLTSGKYFSDYHTLIFVFQITQSGASEYVTLTYPTPVFTNTSRKFSAPFNTKDINRYMNFYYINNNTFKIDSSSYVEMREIWGIK